MVKVNESPLGPDALQKTPFATPNPNLTLHQVQKIKVRTKQQIKQIKTSKRP
jgi:hypothetical protein